MLWPELSAQPTTAYADDGCCNQIVEMSCTPLDIRNILPPSLDNLRLGGVFDKEEWEGVVGPLAAPNEELPNLTIDKIRVEGRVRNRVTNRDEGTIVAFGGWDAVEEKVVFGRADKAWLERAWVPCELFDEHGW